MAKKKTSKKKVAKKTAAKKVATKPEPTEVQTFLAKKREFAAAQAAAFQERFPR